MSIFKEYADIVQQEKIIAERKKELQEQCLSELKNNEQKTAKSEFGTFTVVERKSFNYSEELKTLEIGYSGKLQSELKKTEIKFIDENSQEHDKIIELRRKEESEPERLEIKESLRFQSK